jgi:plastocyanin
VRSRHLISSLVAMAATAMLLAGCGGSGSASAPAKSTAASPATASAGSASAVKISGFKFAPATLTVRHGAGISVTNEDSTAHTATADDGHSFDTGPLDQGASQTVTVSKPGTYPYHCMFHSFMHGRLVVK